MKKNQPRHSSFSEKKLRRRNHLIIFLFCAVTACIVIWFLSECRIKTVAIENASAVKEETILEAAGIKTGRHLYAIDKDKIASDVKSVSPYIKSVTVKRQLPSKLRIVVEEYAPFYYIEYSDAFWILSDSLLVLEKLPDEASAAQLGSIHLILPEIKTCEVGKPLVFADEADQNTVSEILSVFQSAAFPESLTWIDISEKFDITASMQNKYKIFYGTAECLEEKIRFSLHTIQYLAENMYGVTGNIYASKPEEASFEITGVSKTE